MLETQLGVKFYDHYSFFRKSFKIGIFFSHISKKVVLFLVLDGYTDYVTSYVRYPKENCITLILLSFEYRTFTLT